jgi:hypothetical protein
MCRAVLNLEVTGCSYCRADEKGRKRQEREGDSEERKQGAGDVETKVPFVRERVEEKEDGKGDEASSGEG